MRKIYKYQHKQNSILIQLISERNDIIFLELGGGILINFHNISEPDDVLNLLFLDLNISVKTGKMELLLKGDRVSLGKFLKHNVINSLQSTLEVKFLSLLRVRELLNNVVILGIRPLINILYYPRVSLSISSVFTLRRLFVTLG